MRCAIICVLAFISCIFPATSARSQEKAAIADVKKEKQDDHKTGAAGGATDKQAQPKVFSFDLGLKGSFAEDHRRPACITSRFSIPT